MKTKKWHNQKSKDIYIKKASKFGFVSRSAFKIIEIEKKFNIIKKSNSIIEFGASPGGWTQVILELKKNHDFNLICVDKKNLKISLDKKYLFIKEDFYEYKKINIKINNFFEKKFNLILSDMSPNTMGHNNTDHLKIIQLAEDVFNFSKNFLEKKGNLVLKIFQGSNQEYLVSKIKKNFKLIKYFKPDSSRKNSPEIYLICLSYVH